MNDPFKLALCKPSVVPQQLRFCKTLILTIKFWNHYILICVMNNGLAHHMIRLLVCTNEIYYSNEGTNRNKRLICVRFIAL